MTTLWRVKYRRTFFDGIELRIGKKVEKKVFIGIARKVFASYRRRFKNPRIGSDFVGMLKGHLVRNNRTLRRIIRMADKASSAVIALYGGFPLSLPSKNILVIKRKFWNICVKKAKKISASFSIFLDAHTLGLCLPSYEVFIISEMKTRREYAHFLFHEMIHFKYSGHEAIVLSKTRDKKRIYTELVTSKMGLRTLVKGHMVFQNLDEAIVEILAIDFVKKKVSLNPFFRRDVPLLVGPERNETLSDFEEDGYIVGRYFNTKGKCIEEKMMFPYPVQRKALVALITKIAEKREMKAYDVFKVFCSAMCSGNIIPLGRLIDNTFGVGTFRALASVDNALTDAAAKRLKQFIDHL